LTSCHLTTLAFAALGYAGTCQPLDRGFGVGRPAALLGAAAFMSRSTRAHDLLPGYRTFADAARIALLLRGAALDRPGGERRSRRRAGHGLPRGPGHHPVRLPDIDEAEPALLSSPAMPTRTGASADSSHVSARAAAGARHGLAFEAFLLATALACGAFVMVVEVMGSRVIGPFFGVSLFVWTALITVTLVSLAAGYAVGGLVSARRGTPDTLYAIVLAAGLLALAVPILRAPVLRAAVPLGLRVGALAASAVLFGPALFLLGAVSPILLRIAAREIETVGRTAGAISAISTLGSFLGTVATGFVLIAWFGVERIFQMVGAALIGVALVWFVGFRRRLVALLAVAALGLAARGERPLVSKVLPNGTRLDERLRHDGFYGSLRVVDYSGGGMVVRELVLDGQIQGGMDLATGRSAYAYPYFLQFLPWAARPGGATCLVVGLGPGVVPRWFEERGVRTDVVEINPDVVDAARRWFGFAVSGEVFVDDARHFLSATSRRYDYVVLDAFGGDTAPSHLLSREALGVVADRLAPGGVLAVNLIGRFDAGSTMLPSVVRTLREVFATVSVHPVGGTDGLANVAVVATRAPRLGYDPARVAEFAIHPLAGDVRARLFEVREPPPEAAVVLTDDHNPADALDVPLREAARRAMLGSTDWDVLL
jgi:spermidine synthase